VDVRELQRRAWDNKIARGFNTTDVALEFGLLTAERMAQCFRDLDEAGHAAR